MEPFSVRIALTLADWRAYQKVCVLRLQGQGSPAAGIATFAAFAVIGFAIIWAVHAVGWELSLSSALFGIVFGIATIVLSRRQMMKSAYPEEGGSFFSPSTCAFSAAGIESTQDGLRAHVQWSRVRAVTASAEHIFLWVDRLAAYVVPVRDLPPGITKDEAVARLQAWRAAPAADVTSPDAVATAGEDPSHLTQATSPRFASGPWLLPALRLLTWRSSGAAALSVTIPTIVALSLFSLALWAGFDWLRTEPDPQFFAYGLPALSWFILAALLTAVAMAKRSHPSLALQSTCALLAIVIPVLLSADYAIERYVPTRWAGIALLGLALYAVVYCARGLKILTGSRQPAALATGLLIAFSALWLSQVWYVQPTAWVAGESTDDESDPGDWAASETILFDQPARIDAALANISRPPGAVPVGFFVGFAGYGEQRVFAEEIKFASRVFAQRYATGQRTVLLLNDRRTLDAPLASVSGLRYALEGVAAKMDVERDILFLALSSHGSEDPLLSVSNGAIPLHDLTAESLAEALRESKIKWRVIVISACHAGAFIAPLRDPHTIVITAAAADRTSFGCSDERDLTYFGEAFFRDALPKAASLRDAFDAAKALIAQRERQEGVNASNPQAFFGAAMERRLSETYAHGP